MAPALTDIKRETNYFDEATSVAEKLANHCRRTLRSVDNFVAPMEDEEMGLQSQPYLVKDSQEMEQILVDLGSSDLVQVDLLQAIKTLEGTGDGLSTGDTDAIFPLSGFDLAEPMDSEGDTSEDKIKMMQARLDRRCAFLQRRLRILQARAVGKRVSEEAAQTFDKCLRGVRKDAVGRTVGLKSLLKRVETTATLQASAASRTTVGPKYYHAGTSKGDVSKSASISVPSGTLAGLEDTAGALRSHLSAVKHELDSDATLSSSGAESNDEAVVYNNPHQQPMSIDKRALWSWQRARASIASRWSWLQAQIQELEYKVRQHSDLQRQVRLAKGPVQFDGEPVGYEGPLPGAGTSDDDPKWSTCARVRPLRRDTFKKRKLLQMHNLHLATVKATKPSDIRCSCVHPVECCSVCTGRAVPTEPLPSFSTLNNGSKIALADPGYHAVLSDVKDISSSVHLSALCSKAWFRSRCVRVAPKKQSNNQTNQPKPLKVKEEKIRLKRGRPPNSVKKLREKEREKEKDKVRERDKTKAKEPENTTETSVVQESKPNRVGRPSTESRYVRLNSSYDIDNIVIPQSVAANTRPQILHYKEIITPKWRVLDYQEPLNNGDFQSHYLSDSDEEDVSEEAVRCRHSRSEAQERSKYMRKQKSRRSQHNSTETNEALNNNELANAVSSIGGESIRWQAVRPYSPRQFPLCDETVEVMESAMPLREFSPLNEDESTLSPLSGLEHDDPDDVNWDPDNDKQDKKKTQAYR